MNKRPFNKQQPNKFWFISVNDSFYSGKEGQTLVADKTKSFKFFNEVRAKEVFNELNRRYSVIGGKVQLHLFERKQPPSKNEGKKVEVSKRPKIEKKAD